MADKKFNESYNTAVFTTKFVLYDKKDITVVYHFKEDGAWQFSSDDQFGDIEGVAKVVGLGELVEMDNTILDVADLPGGFFAQRKSKQDKWVIKEFGEQ